ncbi:MAG: DUF2299 family protein [Nitrososphaeraceae archaeon]|nr:DUF2299 family protein [Nitrososphaeraceae archaeon]MDW3604959.1 DUF2299 family protein [Nitrososphaeraceae archaeon]MDW3612028.1 DUF2299 family protein [Nitrososphaeraceae archaeon]MDW3626856.1 DUF2299 family protein [Nitrososphaeraceae archaeon]MDW3631126.1 DUF2299 family protein [Nitrososphaeraceae archaeon]
MTDKIKTWLKDEDVHYNKIEDNSTDLHITLWFSKDIRLEAIVWNDKLTISSNVMYFSEDLKNLLLVNESYCDELDLLLHQQVPNFVFLYSNDELTNLAGVRIFKDIWSDSLTKTSFFDTIVAVQHSIYIVKIKEREWAKLKV